MQAEIIAVGSELLTPQRLDTNSLYLTDQLNGIGVELVTKCVVGDNRDRLAEAVRRAARSSEIVIITGGLGPTEDDVTRDAVATALDRPPLHDVKHNAASSTGTPLLKKCFVTSRMLRSLGSSINRYRRITVGQVSTAPRYCSTALRGSICQGTQTSLYMSIPSYTR